MTMKTLESSNEKQISYLLRVTIVSIPVIVGLTIVLSSEIYYWLSQKELPRGGYKTICCAFIGSFIDVAPFILISIYLLSLILKRAGRTEICLKLACMLTPVSLVTTYALFAFADALALSFLVYFNLALLFVGQLLATRIYKSLRVN